jgi:hypothetical protein
MKSIKCAKCGLVNFETQPVCKRCGVSLAVNGSKDIYSINKKTQEFVFTADRNSIAVNEPENVKDKAWKKIKWGLIISFVGFAITFGAISLGVFAGYDNTDREYLTRVKAFSFITLLPLAAVLAGIIELVTGISIFKIIEKWEELPEWLGWLIGISAFLLIITVIMVVAAVIIFNFF